MFVFLHIPKAAGTTVRELIKDQLKPDKPIRIDDISRIAYMPDKWLNSHDFITGHFGASLLNRLDSGAKKYTMLRDPVARVKSQYMYLKKLATLDVSFNGYSSFIGGKGLYTLLEDRSDPLINSLFRDTQIWSLVSDYQHHYRNFDASDDDILEIAKHNLSAFDCFGIVERMNDSIQVINACFDWNIDIKTAGLVRENTSFPESLTDNEVQLDDFIRENNKLDILLYEWALKEIDIFPKRNSETQTDAFISLPDRPVINIRSLVNEIDSSNSELSNELIKQRVLNLEVYNSELADINQKLSQWAENADIALGKEKELSAKFRQWAENADIALAKEKELCAKFRQWAENSDIALAKEKELCAKFRQWAENADIALAKEKEISSQLRQIID